MKPITQQVQINADKAAIWHAITDIDHCEQMIEGIINVEVLNKPTDGIVGLKWKETRVMFGKEADETMWITEAVDNQYYATRAENHGAVYLSKLVITEADGQVFLTMSFTAEPQTFMAKVLSFLMAPMMKGSMNKMLAKDLADIKAFVEGKGA